MTIQCPNVLDRTKPIYISPLRRKQRSELATISEVNQMRSVVGSLSWLARTCRPDLSFRVNQLQAVQQRARVEDLLETNKLLDFALRTKEQGMYYPKLGCRFEELVIVSVTDASHAASLEDVGGTVAGNRSQTGRLLVMAPPDFEKTGKGHVHVLQWTSKHNSQSVSINHAS